jgi:hypothetical protein
MGLMRGCGGERGGTGSAADRVTEAEAFSRSLLKKLPG